MQCAAVEESARARHAQWCMRQGRNQRQKNGICMVVLAHCVHSCSLHKTCSHLGLGGILTCSVGACGRVESCGGKMTIALLRCFITCTRVLCARCVFSPWIVRYSMSERARAMRALGHPRWIVPWIETSSWRHALTRSALSSIVAPLRLLRRLVPARNLVSGFVRS